MGKSGNLIEVDRIDERDVWKHLNHFKIPAYNSGILQKDVDKYVELQWYIETFQSFRVGANNSTHLRTNHGRSHSVQVIAQLSKNPGPKGKLAPEAIQVCSSDPAL